MITATILAALVYGMRAHPLTIVNGVGLPVQNATVVFTDANGARDTERTDAHGDVAARRGFAPLRALVTASGYAPLDITLSRVHERISLHRQLRVIGSVRVATGSLESLHALPVAASLLDAAAVRSSSALTSDGLLREMPGFDRVRSNSAFTNYGQLRVSFGGAGSDLGLLRVDGVPAQDGFGGQIDWAAYPIADIERAQILRGAGSALYGSGAVGGVLDLKTFGPNANTHAPPNGSLLFSGGTHSFTAQAANARAALSRTLTASASLAQQQLEYNDFPPSFSSSVDTIAQSQSNAAAIRLRYAPSPGAVFEVGARGAWDYQAQGRPNYLFWRRWQQQDVRYLHSTAHTLLAATFFSRNAFVTNLADQFPTKPGVLRYTQYVPTIESGAGLTWTVDSGASAFQMRSDGRWVRGGSDQYTQTGAFQNSGSGSQQSGGLALQETLRGRRTEVVVGARLDRVTFSNGILQSAGSSGLSMTRAPVRTDSALSPRIALRYNLTPQLAFRVSDGGGFRAPYLNELVRGYFIGATDYEPNPSLVPERSGSLSTGFDWANGRSRLSIDGIHTTVRDAIAFLTIDKTHQERSNFQRTQSDGATLTYTQALGPCSRLSFWATLQYARVTAGLPQTIGKRLPYIPDGDATVAYDGAIGKIDAGFSASYLGQTYADDLNRDPLGTAIVIGAHVGLPLAGGAALVLGGDNVTDARYRSSIDRYAPPAIMSISFRMPVGPATKERPALCGTR